MCETYIENENELLQRKLCIVCHKPVSYGYITKMCECDYEHDFDEIHGFYTNNESAKVCHGCDGLIERDDE